MRRGNVGSVVCCPHFHTPFLGPSVTSMIEAPRQRSRSAFYSRCHPRGSARGAVWDAGGGRGTIFVTALGCGQGTNRTHTPRLSALASLSDLYAATSAASASSRRTPLRSRHIANRIRDSGAAPRRRSAIRRPRRAAARATHARSAAPAGAAPAPDRPAGLHEQRAQLAGPGFGNVPFHGGAPPELSSRRHQAEKRARPRRIAIKAAGSSSTAAKVRPTTGPTPGRRHQCCAIGSVAASALTAASRPSRSNAVSSPQPRLRSGASVVAQRRRQAPGASSAAHRRARRAAAGQPPALVPQHRAQQIDRRAPHLHQVSTDPQSPGAARAAPRETRCARAIDAEPARVGQRRGIAADRS